MNRQFILIPKQSPTLTIVFTFDLNGLLNSFKLDGKYTDRQWQWVVDHIPQRADQIESYRKNDKFLIKEVPPDLSFDAFWKRYNHKIGKKAVAERLWSALNEGDRIKAMLYIPRYDQQLIQTGYAKVYPEGYVRNRYFDE